MDKLAVSGDKIVLQPPPGVVWQGWDGRLPLQGLQSARRITSQGQPVVLEADLPVAALQSAGKLYIAPPFITPGTLLTLQLTVIPPTLSASVKLMGQKVLTQGTKGTYTLMVAPAINPSGPSPVPDPMVSKVGQWSVETTTQSAFASGIPMPAPAIGDNGTPGGGDDGAGSGGDAEDSGESDDHYVAITVQDVDGNPLGGQFAMLTLPSGRRLRRQLSGEGGTREDGVRGEDGDTAVVNMVFDPELAPVDAEDSFLAVEVVNESGAPLTQHQLMLTLDGRHPIESPLDSRGKRRMDGLPEGLEGRIEIEPDPAEGGTLEVFIAGCSGTLHERHTHNDWYRLTSADESYDDIRAASIAEKVDDDRLKLVFEAVPESTPLTLRHYWGGACWTVFEDRLVEEPADGVEAAAPTIAETEVLKDQPNEERDEDADAPIDEAEFSWQGGGFWSDLDDLLAAGGDPDESAESQDAGSETGVA